MEVKVNLDETNVVISRKAAPKEMLSVTREGDRTKVRINSSSLGIIQECPRKAFYSLEQKWRPDNETPATLFGSAIHKALEVFYAGDIAERKMPKWEVLELMSYGHRTDGDDTDLLLRSVRAFVEKAEPLKELPESDKRSIQNGVYTLYHYFKAYIADPYVIYSDEDGPFTERQFSLIVYEDDKLIIELFGTIDFVFQHRLTKEILPGDHKTTSSLSFGGSSYYDRDRPNLQYSCYAMGIRRVFGLHSDQFLVNMIEVKAKPKTSKGSPPSFPRQLTLRDEDDFSELTDCIYEAVTSYLKWKRNGKWPMGPLSACNLYGGCNFKAVCSAPTSMRETILKAKFTQGEKCV